MPCEHSSQERFAGEPECLCVKPRMSVQVPAFREHNLVTVLRRKESSPSVFVSPVSLGGSMSKLKHAVSGHAKNIDSDMIAHHGQLERATVAEHDIMRDDYVNTEKLFNEMRHDFNRFLSKYM